MELPDDVRTRDAEHLVAALERVAAEVVGAQLAQLQVGPGGAVIDEDALARQSRGSSSPWSWCTEPTWAIPQEASVSGRSRIGPAKLCSDCSDSGSRRRWRLASGGRRSRTASTLGPTPLGHLEVDAALQGPGEGRVRAQALPEAKRAGCLFHVELDAVGRLFEPGREMP